MEKPIIGITVESKHDPADERSGGNMSLNWNYAQAIADAGGVPIIIPPTADPDSIAPLLDGWLIPGGLDIDASHFGQENHPAVELQDPSRFQIEEALYQRVSPEMPILGICYGCQFLNVIRGGTLHQHLPDLLSGENYHSGGTLAPVRVEEGTRLNELVGAEVVDTKSYHHQAIDQLGEGLRVSARHEDGIVEAIEATDRPWQFAVQWHPERTMKDPATQRLFSAFISAARDFRASRGGR